MVRVCSAAEVRSSRAAGGWNCAVHACLSAGRAGGGNGQTPWARRMKLRPGDQTTCGSAGSCIRHTDAEIPWHPAHGQALFADQAQHLWHSRRLVHGLFPGPARGTRALPGRERQRRVKKRGQLQQPKPISILALRALPVQPAKSRPYTSDPPAPNHRRPADPLGAIPKPPPRP